MAKLCPRGKAAAKRKFKVYPSAYANMYASAVCSGKVTPGGKKNRKKAMGGGMMNRPKFNKGGGADKQTSESRALRKNLDALIAGVFFTRDLVSEPGNILHPDEYAKRLL